jgi:hypothetical protein
MSILQIIAHVKEHCIPGNFDHISKQTHPTNLRCYVYMQMLVAVVMIILSTGANKSFQTGT